MRDNGHERTLFVSGVDVLRPHPSANLANSYAKLGTQVIQLFLDVRNLKGLLHDFHFLQNILGKSHFTRVIANVNGPMAQCLILLAARKKNIRCEFWMMDCYPGCLKYVTRFWWLFWIPFFILTFIVKRCSASIYYIDEAFPKYSPSFAKKKFEIIRLARPKIQPVGGCSDRRTKGNIQKTIGIVGNIEQRWIDEDFNDIYAEIIEAGYSIVVATSSNGNLDNFIRPSIRLISPWLKEDTDRVFDDFRYILVPLSDSRIYYSSPSKIIDAYARGIQPVIYGSKAAWVANRNRKVYRKSIHYSDFISNCRPFSRVELKHFAKEWPSDFENIVTKTLIGGNQST